MIKDFLLHALPRRRAASDPPRDRRGERRQRRLFLVLAVILLLSGWFAPAWASVGVLIVLWWLSSTIDEATAPRQGFGRIVLITIFAAATAGTTLFLYLTAGVSFDRSQIFLALCIGMAVAAVWEEGTVRKLMENRTANLLEAVRRPMTKLAETGAQTIAFDPHFPFQSPDNNLVWAVDPARRSIRVMAPAHEYVDRSIEWDEPIRAVQFQRIERSRWLPMLSDTLAIVRRDRKLTIVSGPDSANEWSYVFRFSGLDRETALRWREIFEAWMNADRARALNPG